MSRPRVVSIEHCEQCPHKETVRLLADGWYAIACKHVPAGEFHLDYGPPTACPLPEADVYQVVRQQRLLHPEAEK